MVVTPETTAFLESRALDAEIATHYGVHTAKRGVVGIQYRRDGEVKYNKLRNIAEKGFSRDRKGAETIFFNVDALYDPALEEDRECDGKVNSLIITEGEFDAIAAIQSGYPLSVSVPDGAPPPTKRDPNESEVSDAHGKFDFLWRERKQIKKIKRFILAVDSDEPGARLKDELLHRLGAGRCAVVEYPEGCKDLNEVLANHGEDGVRACINGAKPVPVQGLYKLSDYPELELRTFSTGFGPEFDKAIKLVPGEFMVVTGIPQHGKSSWTLNLLANLANKYGWGSAIFSPEMPVVPILRSVLRNIRSSQTQLEKPRDADPWINQHFSFISNDPNGEDEGDFSLEWVLDTATEAVLRYGIRVLVIDPWNEVEHCREKGESMVDYIGRGIRKMKRWAKERNCVVIVVAHPTKLPRNSDGGYDAPTLYDIEGAAHWYNKPDHGVVIFRRSGIGNAMTEFHVKKVRWQGTGLKDAAVAMKFDQDKQTFEEIVQYETQEAA